MDAGGRGGIYNPKTVEEVYKDYLGRRGGLIKALTTEVEQFYRQCDPEKENLCLYGFPSEKWEVNLPAEEVPPELPEPALGINFARDGMPKKDWLSLVAVHSDAWLLSVAYYFGARFAFDQSHSKKTYNNASSHTSPAAPSSPAAPPPLATLPTPATPPSLVTPLTPAITAKMVFLK